MCGVWVGRCMRVCGVVCMLGVQICLWWLALFSRGAHFMCKRGRKRCIPVIESFREAIPYRDGQYIDIIVYRDIDRPR